jgi:hypothetical protein
VTNAAKTSKSSLAGLKELLTIFVARFVRIAGSMSASPKNARFAMRCLKCVLANGEESPPAQKSAISLRRGWTGMGTGVEELPAIVSG